MNTPPKETQEPQEPITQEPKTSIGFESMFDFRTMKLLWEIKCAEAWRFDGKTTNFGGQILTELEEFFYSVGLTDMKLFYSFELDMWASGRRSEIPPIYTNTGLQIEIYLSFQMVSKGLYKIRKPKIVAKVSKVNTFFGVPVHSSAFHDQAMFMLMFQNLDNVAYRMAREHEPPNSRKICAEYCYEMGSLSSGVKWNPELMNPESFQSNARHLRGDTSSADTQTLLRNIFSASCEASPELEKPDLIQQIKDQVAELNKRIAQLTQPAVSSGNGGEYNLSVEPAGSTAAFLARVGMEFIDLDNHVTYVIDSVCHENNSHQLSFKYHEVNRPDEVGYMPCSEVLNSTWCQWK